jgi:hypothetical protein
MPHTASRDTDPEAAMFGNVVEEQQDPPNHLHIIVAWCSVRINPPPLVKPTLGTLPSSPPLRAAFLTPALSLAIMDAPPVNFGPPAPTPDEAPLLGSLRGLPSVAPAH